MGTFTLFLAFFRFFEDFFWIYRRNILKKNTLYYIFVFEKTCWWGLKSWDVYETCRFCFCLCLYSSLFSGWCSSLFSKCFWLARIGLCGVGFGRFRWLQCLLFGGWLQRCQGRCASHPQIWLQVPRRCGWPQGRELHAQGGFCQGRQGDRFGYFQIV